MSTKAKWTKDGSNKPHSMCCRLLILPVIGLLVGCLLGSSLAAQEPDWATTAWPSTEWSVGCDEYELEQMGDACNRTGENRDGLILALEYELDRASAWLKDLGFRAPAANQAPADGALPGDYRYDATITADPEHFERGRCGAYTSSQQLLVRWDCLFAVAGRAPDDPSDSRPGVVDSVIGLLSETVEMFTSTHELFHAVERNYESEQITFSGDHKWITEGMADAVELAYMMKFEPEIVSDFRNPGRLAAEIDDISEDSLDPAVSNAFAGDRNPRWYDKPLHEPPDKASAYKTHEFWLFTGRFLDSTDIIQYLHDVLLADLGPAKGLPGVSIAMSQLHPQGLYDIYPEFIKSVAKDQVYFEQVDEIELRGQRPGPIEKVLEAEGVNPVASNAYRVKVNIPPNQTMGLIIGIENHPEIHLVVDDERYDRGTLSEAGSRRNQFRTTVSGSQEFFVRVANVSQNAADSELTYFNLTATLVDEYAYMGTSAGGGGSSPSSVDIDAPLPIEFDQFKRRTITDIQTERHQRLGHEDICMLQFEFVNSETKDGMAIRMDHEGPIAPGEYPIFNPGESGLDFRYMEENPGIAMVSYGLGKGSSLTNGYSFGYVGKSGTLTLEKVTQNLVVGRVQVTGDRIVCLDPNGSRSIIGNIFDCPGPETLTAESVFSIRPGGSPSSKPASSECFERDAQRSQQQDEPPSDEGVVASGPDLEVSTPETGPETISGAGTGYQVPDGNEWLRLQISGAVERTLLMQPPEVMTSGGCDGSSVMSLGYITGGIADESAIMFSFETADVVATSATGPYELRDVDLDYGFTSPPHLPESAGIRVPVRYSGEGQLQLTIHDTAMSDRRLGGTVTTDLATRDGQHVSVSAEFRFPMSCGVTVQ